MKKSVFYLATAFVFMAVSFSCRPKLGTTHNECRKTCSEQAEAKKVACYDRCQCYHKNGQDIDKCNAEYDAGIK
ncbi:hypothetical protein DKG77_14360 [Flagellimonas aquimarina]|jgi:hypothetical protein|uniref:Uncharacterized protein n=1 Tax=Flagellimonas aquimarina TaxID=2201895 RepID=A0A316KUP5_9FLAO|nr:hypothetical protein DKG77_14360 [Allomuricauda koreensis]